MCSFSPEVLFFCSGVCWFFTELLCFFSGVACFSQKYAGFLPKCSVIFQMHWFIFQDLLTYFPVISKFRFSDTWYNTFIMRRTSGPVMVTSLFVRSYGLKSEHQIHLVQSGSGIQRLTKRRCKYIIRMYRWRPAFVNSDSEAVHNLIEPKDAIDVVVVDLVCVQYLHELMAEVGRHFLHGYGHCVSILSELEQTDLDWGYCIRFKYSPRGNSPPLGQTKVALPVKRCHQVGEASAETLTGYGRPLRQVHGHVGGRQHKGDV